MALFDPLYDLKLVLYTASQSVHRTEHDLVPVPLITPSYLAPCTGENQSKNRKILLHNNNYDVSDDNKKIVGSIPGAILAFVYGASLISGFRQQQTATSRHHRQSPRCQSPHRSTPSHATLATPKTCIRAPSRCLGIKGSPPSPPCLCCAPLHHGPAPRPCTTARGIVVAPVVVHTHTPAISVLRARISAKLWSGRSLFPCHCPRPRRCTSPRLVLRPGHASENAHFTPTNPLSHTSSL